MHGVRQYENLPSATFAASFLRSQGILARAHQREVGSVRLGYMGMETMYEFWVVIAFQGDHEVAIEILDEFDAMPLPDEDEWQDQTEPDLSKLPMGLVVPCEWCKADFRSDINDRTRPGERIRCRSCDRDNDPVERVVARHGPEALADCYPEPADPDWIDPETLKLLLVPCPSCQSCLSGLPPIGRCPGCTKPYNKWDIIETTFQNIQMLPPGSEPG